MPQHNGNVHDDRERSEFAKSTVHVGTNTDLHLRYFILYNISIVHSLFFSRHEKKTKALLRKNFGSNF